MKNKITIYVDGEKIELYDFSKVDHYVNSERKYSLRILCGNKFYYYPLQLTSIGMIECYE